MRPKQAAQVKREGLCSVHTDLTLTLLNNHNKKNKKKDRNKLSSSHINSSRSSHHAARRAKTQRDSPPLDRGWGTFFCSNFFSFCCPALAQALEPSSRANKTQWSIIVTLWKDFYRADIRLQIQKLKFERHIADMFQYFLSFSSRSFTGKIITSRRLLCFSWNHLWLMEFTTTETRLHDIVTVN